MLTLLRLVVAVHGNEVGLQAAESAKSMKLLVVHWNDQGFHGVLLCRPNPCCMHLHPSSA
jgi:hypothetical protein